MYITHTERRWLFMFSFESLRKARGQRSLATVARLLRNRGYKVTKASLSCWERGLRMPRADIVGILAEVYGVDIKSFYIK